MEDDRSTLETENPPAADTNDEAILSFHVLYSEIYNVPVIYFHVTSLDTGKPIETSSIHEFLQEVILLISRIPFAFAHAISLAIIIFYATFGSRVLREDDW